MSRIKQAFEKRSSGAAFMPFFTAGDPDIQTTHALVKAAAAHGADIVEIGVPFSDPIADGPTIQASYYRALDAGFKVQHVFDLAQGLRADGVDVPLVCMVSHTLVYRRGPDAFFKTARAAGFDGMIIPDLPAGYEGDASEKAAAHGLDHIFLCAPTTTDERRALIAKKSRGFIYYISVAGITGARDSLPPDLAQNVADLKARTDTPICVGFGIGKPEQAAAVAQMADGVIVGSALVKQAAAWSTEGLDRARMAEQMGAAVKALADAAHGT